MVSIISIVFMVITVIIVFGLPIALTIWIIKKYHTGFVPVAVGMLIFFVTQIVVRIQIINILQTLPRVQAFIAAYPLLYIAILSVTAGIFEEFGRLFGFSVMLKRRRALSHGVAYGIGHGGIEAIFLVGFAYINNIVYSTMINSGTMDSLIQLSPEAVTSQLQTAAAALIESPSYMFLLGGIERIIAIALHIGLSVLVLYGVRRKKIGYTFLAIAVHTLVNFIGVSLMQYVHLFAEFGFMIVVGVLSVIFVLKMRKAFEKLEPPLPVV